MVGVKDGGHKADFWQNTSLPNVLLKNLKNFFLVIGHLDDVIIYDEFFGIIGNIWRFFN